MLTDCLVPFAPPHPSCTGSQNPIDLAGDNKNNEDEDIARAIAASLEDSKRNGNAQSSTQAVSGKQHRKNGSVYGKRKANRHSGKSMANQFSDDQGSSMSPEPRPSRRGSMQSDDSKYYIDKASPPKKYTSEEDDADEDEEVELIQRKPFIGPMAGSTPRKRRAADRQTVPDDEDDYANTDLDKQGTGRCRRRANSNAREAAGPSSQPFYPGGRSSARLMSQRERRDEFKSTLGLTVSRKERSPQRPYDDRPWTTRKLGQQRKILSEFQQRASQRSYDYCLKKPSSSAAAPKGKSSPTTVAVGDKATKKRVLAIETPSPSPTEDGFEILEQQSTPVPALPPPKTIWELLSRQRDSAKAAGQKTGRRNLDEANAVRTKYSSNFLLHYQPLLAGPLTQRVL